jgi:hypothetical protein
VHGIQFMMALAVIQGKDLNWSDGVFKHWSVGVME